MGSSQSDEARSRKSTYRNLSVKSSIHTRKSHFNKEVNTTKKLKQWRQAFKEAMALVDKTELPYWKSIQTALKKYIQEFQDDESMEELISQQFLTLTSPTTCSQSSPQKGSPISIFVPESQEEEKIDAKQLFLCMSEIDPNSSIAIQREFSDRILSPLSDFPNLKRESHLFSTLPLRPSLLQELRKNLLNQIENSNYVLQGLLKTFKLTCVGFFEQEVCQLNWDKYTRQHEALYSCVTGAIKRFIHIMATFISWIYEDLLVNLIDRLEDEDISPEYVIESVLYEILFKAPYSYLADLTMQLLNLKSKSDTNTFQETLERRKPDTLESYDHVLAASKQYLLESSPAPYDNLIQKLKDIQNETNPYAKYELATLLDEEMWNCVLSFYNKSSIQELTKLKESFGTDVRFTISLYCVVQTQCTALVVERKFIEEFISPQVLQMSYGYTTFESCIDYLLKGDLQGSVVSIRRDGK